MLVCTAEDGGGQLPQSVSKAFARLVEVHKMPHATFHGLRHLQASVLLDDGVTAAVVSKRLGLSSIKSTVDTYHHLTRRTDEDAAARGNAALARRRTTPATG